MKKCILIFSVIALLCSCATQKASNYSYSEFQKSDANPTLVITPLIADLEVSNTRIKYGEVIQKDITTMTDAEVKAMAEAEKSHVMANALAAHNADVIVAPNVSIRTNNNHCLEIIITGFPATYKNFHNMTKEDEWMKTKDNCPTKPQINESKKFGFLK